MNSDTKVIFEELFVNYPKLLPIKDDIEKAYHILEECFNFGGKVLVCGNGGSAADSEHIVGELMKGFLRRRPIGEEDRGKLISAFPDDQYLADHLQRALPTISLASQTSLITAIANDVSPDMIFAQQVYAYLSAGDILIAISTSGDSPSVVNAAKVAKAMGSKTIVLTGQTGGTLKTLGEAVVLAPADTSNGAQELHLPIYHTLCAMLEATFYTN